MPRNSQQEDESPLPSRIDGSRLLVPSAYLSAADLGGRDRTLTIDRVVIRNVRSDRGVEKKPVIHFRELDAMPEGDRKVWIISANCNVRAIVQATGEDNPHRWAGKRITLFVGEWKGDDCIRVRPKAPPAQTGAQQPAGPTPAQADRPRNPDAEHLKACPDQELVKATRARMYGTKTPLSADEVRALRLAVDHALDAPQVTAGARPSVADAPPSPSESEPDARRTTADHAGGDAFDDKGFFDV